MAARIAMEDACNLSREITVKVTEEYDGSGDSGAIKRNINEKGENMSCLFGEDCNSRKSSGGWRAACLLLANQGLATLAFFGVGVNLVLFLTRVLGQDNATAANSVSNWTGTVYMCSLVAAFLSDSYWGHYLTCGVFQLIFLMGLLLLSFSSWHYLIHPKGCGDKEQLCFPSSSVGIALFYISIYSVAFGYGGHQPTLATLGADQFDDTDEKQNNSRGFFFSYFYFALNVGSLFSDTILAYQEDSGEWTIGFVVSSCSAVLALVLFLMGTPNYRYFKPRGNPWMRIAQVFIAAARKWYLVEADEDDLYEGEGLESAIKGSPKILHSGNFRLLDKAATMSEEELHGPRDPWRLCTVTQVEEAKCLLKMLPIWLCTIIYSVVFAQMSSLFVEQGAMMNPKIGNFEIPAASMSVFDICSVLAFTYIYCHVLVPLAGRISKNPKGLTELQRMGTGLIIGMLAIVAAGITEIERLKRVIPNQHTSSLSIFWQVPQYVLVGASEVFMYVGQLEFFNAQASDGMKSFGSSLCMASMSLGNYVSSFIVMIVKKFTARGSSPGWIADDLNTGHIDRFYFLIAGLVAVNFLVYVFCAKRYKCINAKAGEERSKVHAEGEAEEDLQAN